MANLIDVYSNSVQAWQCDHMGHLNVQFYVEKATSGLAVLGHHLGLGPDIERSLGARLRAREHHIRFLREQRPGAPLRIRAGLLDSGPDRLRAYEEMTNPGSGDVAATFVTEAALVDAGTGNILPLPEAVTGRADGLRTALPEHAAPRGLELGTPRRPPRIEDADRLALLHTYLDQVQPAMCDPDGLLATRSYMGMVSDAVANLLEQLGGDRSDSGIGGAALEYRFIYHQAPRAGDLLAVRSGIRSVGRTAYSFCHWLFNYGTGECIATAEAVAVMLDLKARKAIPIPDARRATLERAIIPDLGV